MTTRNHAHTDLAREWQPLVDDSANVIKLVHLAARFDSFDVEELRVEISRKRRLAYEQELEIQAARVGCPGRRARLTNNSIISEINEESKRDAASIVNTYNFDLATQLIKVRSETPTANRNTYASRLRPWKDARAKWKDPQINEWSTNTAVARAQTDFHDINSTFGTAQLRPRKAVCPICIGWINRGDVPVRVATNNPPPYHLNCPHFWKFDTEKIARQDCPLLWMGE